MTSIQIFLSNGNSIDNVVSINDHVLADIEKSEVESLVTKILSDDELVKIYSKEGIDVVARILASSDFEDSNIETTTFVRSNAIIGVEVSEIDDEMCESVMQSLFH